VQRVSSIIIHNWPGLRGLGWAVFLLGYFLAQGFWVIDGVSEMSVSVWLAVLLVMTLVVFWWAYCRVTITPWEVRLVSSGLYKHRYSAPLEGVKLNGQWLLPAQIESSAAAGVTMTFEVDEDFDTGEEYIWADFAGKQVALDFPVKQYAALEAAFSQMATQRQNIEDNSVIN
jgi:hypothetical protein